MRTENKEQRVNRFYVRTDDYLVEDRYLSGRNEEQDRTYIIADDICNYETAIVISNALRTYHHLSQHNYDERLKFLQRDYPSYPNIEDCRKKVKKNKKVKKI